MDIAKMTPAPWTCEPSCCGPNWGFDVPEIPEADYRDSRFGNQADAEFIAMARNAFDVIMRRGWWVVRNADLTWSPRLAYLRDFEIEDKKFSDPFTALVEADKWMKEHEGGSSCQQP